MNPDGTPIPPPQVPDPAMQVMPNPVQMPAQPVPQQYIPAQPLPNQTYQQPMAPAQPAQFMTQQPVAAMSGMYNASPTIGSPMMQSSPKSKKPLIIIGAIVAVILVVGGIIAFSLLSTSELIGSLSQETYGDLKFSRPSAWIKVTSSSISTSYHPSQSLGKGSDGKPTYALQEVITQNKGATGGFVAKNVASDQRASALATLNNSIKNPTDESLPTASELGCSEAPKFKDKPVNATINNAFWAIKYTMTCTKTVGSAKETHEFGVIDTIPYATGDEYVIAVGAASESVYKTNQVKIDQILASAAF